MMSTSSTQKRRSSSFVGIRCGCKDSKSVSVSASQSSSSDMKSTTRTLTTRRARELSSADTMTLTSPSTSSYWEEEAKLGSSASTPSFSGLLRQLNELEQDVMSWGRCTARPTDDKEEERKRWHQRSGSEGAGGRRVEESVAVVKETEDPLGEFRRSMLQMIVEKEIVDGEELRELLRRFLALNSPRHHDTILRAFAEIWEEVFTGHDNYGILAAVRRNL
ncbi:transcription repressor OFP8-like [Musa acuminata AAA Group]|uniref:transcription repressor OFP8-like n=1 Tax=Musa acuminata AAA Group TaxID=214697 RepID=UPI0031DDD94E